jgi:thioredoxin-dependent peroxiredoxin
MRLKSGDRVKEIHLPAIDGSTFRLQDLQGRPYMIAFFRFAACPFCNLRVHELVNHFSEFGENFQVVAIFDSSLDNLQRHAERHRAPFPILADEQNVSYREYGIEHSVTGVVKGLVTRMPSMLNAMFVKGYMPTTIKGRITTMPADFLIDAQGVIRTAYYGKDEGDHLPLVQIKEFSHLATS